MSLSGPVKIIGCGLIGTSIAMRMKELGIGLILSDTNEMNLRLASDLIGESNKVVGNPALIVIATPPENIYEVAKHEFQSNSTALFIEVSGVKSNLLVEVESFPELAKNFASVHPMAGRETSGPESARSDLFESRAWIVSPTKLLSPGSIKAAKDLGIALGSTIYELDSATHDSVVAAISHLPQILSSALGGSLKNESAEHLNLAGQGLRDVSRLADSEPELWSSLLLENSKEISPKISEVINRLSELNQAIESGDRKSVTAFFKDGREGRAKIPGKHGSVKRDYTYVPIVIDDKPGGLARIFNECAAIEVNVEDLSMEHSPGQEVGLITLALSASDADKLQKHLVSKGFLAHTPRKD
jgi:prephenate dehydrogenase